MTQEHTAPIPLAPAPSPRAFTDILRMVRICARAFFRYPRASVKALFYFLNLKTLDDRSQSFEPRNESLKKAFDLIKAEPLFMQGQMVLPNEECWNDYLILAHVFALRLKEKLAGEEDIIIKVRWGLAHGLFNAIVHGDPGRPIHVRWQIAPDEFCLQIANAKNEERMKPHNVAVNGIPVSGMGGTLVIMGQLFDHVNLSQLGNAGADEEIGLALVLRRNKKSRSLREKLAARIAHARDSVQLERIWRKRKLSKL